MNNCKNFHEDGDSKAVVRVDVTRIVKYCCVASVLIVGIIFGASVFNKMLEKQEKDC